jgi:peptidase E
VSDRHIVAIGGGELDIGRGILREVLDLTGAARPRVCYLPTATGDHPSWIVGFYTRMRGEARATHLALFERTRDDVRDVLLDQDAILVAGGNTANLLAVWRTHGVDVALREAWERGVVLAGGSAGANCWFRASTTDSFGPDLQPLRDGLGLLEGSFCPHYDGEEQRRPLYTRLVGEGFPAGYAATDDAAAHFVGTTFERAIAQRDDARVYRVERADDGSVTETPL